jgi:hypothetical protein
MYIYNGTNTVSFTDASTYTQITGASAGQGGPFTSGGQLSNFTFSATGGELTASAANYYHATWSVSVSVNSANMEVEGSLFVNGAQTDFSSHSEQHDTSEPFTMSASGVIHLNAGDRVGIGLQNPNWSAGTNIVTVAHATLSITACAPQGTTGYTGYTGAGGGAGVNSQSGTSYSVVSGDNGKLITLTNAASVAVTLPNANTLSSTFSCFIQSVGAGGAIITPTSCAIDALASGVPLPLAQGQGVQVNGNGSQYWTERGCNNSATVVEVGGTQIAGSSEGIEVNGTLIALGNIPTVVEVNGAVLQNLINLNATTPAAPASGTNVTWQNDSNTPANISAYIAGITPRPNTKKWAYNPIINNGTTSPVGDVWGSGAGSYSSVNASTTEPVGLRATSGSVSGNAAGYGTGNSGAYLNYLLSNSPRFQKRMLLQRTTNIRAWIFFTDQTAATMYGSATPAGNWVGLRFDTSASDSYWQLVVGKAGSATVLATSVAPDTSTHSYEIYYNNSASSVLAYIDGTLAATQSTAANLPANTTLTWAGAYVTTLAASTVYFDSAYDYLEVNW